MPSTSFDRQSRIFVEGHHSNTANEHAEYPYLPAQINTDVS